MNIGDKVVEQTGSEEASGLPACRGNNERPARAGCESWQDPELGKRGGHLGLEEASSAGGGEALRERGLRAGGGLPTRLDCKACLCRRRSSASTAN